MRVQTQRDTFALRIAADSVEVPPDAPHEDWQPIYGDPSFAKWHPAYGESHLKYHVYPIRRGNGKPTVWRANSHGLYQGMGTLTRGETSTAFPQYADDDEPVGLGQFPNMAKAKAAAEQHYAENYGQPQRSVGDYDINQLMRDQGFS